MTEVEPSSIKFVDVDELNNIRFGRSAQEASIGVRLLDIQREFTRIEAVVSTVKEDEMAQRAKLSDHATETDRLVTEKAAELLLEESEYAFGRCTDRSYDIFATATIPSTEPLKRSSVVDDLLRLRGELDGVSEENPSLLHIQYKENRTDTGYSKVMAVVSPPTISMSEEPSGGIELKAAIATNLIISAGRTSLKNAHVVAPEEVRIESLSLRIEALSIDDLGNAVVAELSDIDFLGIKDVPDESRSHLLDEWATETLMALEIRDSLGLTLNDADRIKIDPIFKAHKIGKILGYLRD